MDDDLKAFLRDVSDHVIVVGSYARGTDRADSDIDLLWDEEARPLIKESLAEHGLTWHSPTMGYVVIGKRVDDGVLPTHGIMVELLPWADDLTYDDIKPSRTIDIEGVSLPCL